MSLKSSSYNIRKNESGHVSLIIAETPCEAEGLHLATWSSAFLLSNLLHRLQIVDLSQPRRDEGQFSVLELGAGTGLSGLSAAAIWGTRSLLTDLPTIVPGLQVNVELNRDTVKANGGDVACGTLDWNQPDTIKLHAAQEHGRATVEVDNDSAFPVILAADTMYTEDHPRLLSQTILRCLRRSPSARAIVLYAMRIAYLDHIREFWERMQQGGLVAEQEGREEIDLQEWDDERLHEWSVWKWTDL